MVAAGDGALQSRTRWQTRGDMISPANRNLNDLPAGATAVNVTGVTVPVYLATEVRGGDTFEGEIYLDEIGGD